jgi:hypothetical protein
VEIPNLPNKKIIYIIFGILVIVLIIVLILPNIFKGNPNPIINPEDNTDTVNPYYLPDGGASKGIKITGEIKPVVDLISTPNVKHYLASEDERILVYLKSNNINLDLSLGIRGEVVGNISDEKIDNIRVMDVYQVILK